MKSIAIIPARGGSKRIPHKNIVDFFGKPLIAYTIEAALLSNLFDRVIVSTDSEEIAKVSQSLGAEVPFLRVENADDFTPVSEATLSALLQAESYYNIKFDTVVQLMANCPIRDADLLVLQYEYFIKNRLNFLISCFEYGWTNPWWAATLDETNTPTALFENKNIRSQDLPKLVCPSGSMWIANSHSLQEEKTFYGADHKFFEIPWENAVDIDSYEDLKFAKCIYNFKHQTW